MAASTITIQFTDDLIIGDRLIFNVKTNPDTYPLNWYQNYRWVNTRSAGYQVTTGTPILASAGERAAINFKQAFELDNASFISSGVLNITRNVNEITITAPNTSTFVLFTLENIVPGTSTAASINIVIVDGTFDPFKIDSIAFSQVDTNPCQNVKVTIETSVNIKNVSSPVTASNVNDTVFEFDWLRGQSIGIGLEDYSSNFLNQLESLPSILSPSMFNLQINPSPNGATVVVQSISNDLGFDLLELEYSLDNSTWQSSNTFSGLAVDNYTIYIKDQLGCSISIGFAVTEFNIQSPFFYISKANSIRFANRITWGDAANYKNDENTLSCEVRDKLPYMEVQQFQTADVIPTQFKSNYENHEVKVIRENGSEFSIFPAKVTNYIGNKDLRDARKYDLGGGKTGIYFITGNIYDYDSGTDTGEDHSLNGSLPIWAKAGNYIKVDTEWFLIEDFFFDDNKNAEVIVVSNNYSGTDVAVIAGSIFNIYDFEVYEFTIDMVDFIDEIIQVKIEATDSNFPNITYLSEKIQVSVRHAECLEIKYWNDDNTDVNYATGIKHLIRIPFTKIIDASDESSENNKTDTSTILISSDIYEGSEITFEPTTLEIMRKIRIALSCKHLTIDGVGYVKNGNFEVDQLNDSNLYVLKAKMIKTGSVFSSQSEGVNDFDSSSVEIPGLISIGGDGMLRY